MLHHPEYRERYAANLCRELPRIPFVCHPEAAESSAKQTTPNEGSMHSAGTARKSIDPSARKRRGPQDDNELSAFSVLTASDIFKKFAESGQRLAEIHVHHEQQP